MAVSGKMRKPGIRYPPLESEGSWGLGARGGKAFASYQGNKGAKIKGERGGPPSYLDSQGTRSLPYRRRRERANGTTVWLATSERHSGARDQEGSRRNGASEGEGKMTWTDSVGERRMVPIAVVMGC